MAVQLLLRYGAVLVKSLGELFGPLADCWPAAPGDLTLHDVAADGTAIIAIDDRERKIFFLAA